MAEHRSPLFRVIHADRLIFKRAPDGKGAWLHVFSHPAEWEAGAGGLEASVSVSTEAAGRLLSALLKVQAVVNASRSDKMA